ncbi:MAG TPA: hypothetical protein DCS93_20820 [Microscillaceae bacterium]|nr:hypothetical protein [Microscillaceae bacterium]
MKIAFYLFIVGWSSILTHPLFAQAETTTASIDDLEILLEKRKYKLLEQEKIVQKADTVLQDLKKYDSIQSLFETYQQGQETISKMFRYTQDINKGQFTDYQGLNGLLKKTDYNIGTDWVTAQNFKRFLPNIRIVFKEHSAKLLPKAQEAAIKLGFAEYLIKIHRKRENEFKIEYQVGWNNLISLYDAIRSLYVIKKTVTPMLQAGVVESEFERVRKSRIYRPGMKVYKRYILLIKNEELYRDKIHYIKKAKIFLYKMRDIFHAKNTKTFGKLLKKVKKVSNIESLILAYNVE